MQATLKVMLKNQNIVLIKFLNINKKKKVKKL
jgi:hypothetical protein